VERSEESEKDGLHEGGKLSHLGVSQLDSPDASSAAWNSCDDGQFDILGTYTKGMKEPWCLATSFTDTPGAQIVKLYGKRFTIEESFRDLKNLRSGMGLSDTRISSTERRDRILLVGAIAASLLTLLGAAGEAIGYDMMMKANTVKTRTHSLLNQGLFYFE